MEEYVFFWKVSEKPYGIFSQWSIRNFTIDGNVYCCTEQWMMAEKARLFNDNETFTRIINEKIPFEIKKLGREVKNFNQSVWENNAFDIVVKGNFAKFSQHQDFIDILLSTKDKTIVEASPYDKIWGIGLSSEHPDSNNPENWKGTNLLGKALMEVRDKIQV